MGLDRLVDLEQDVVHRPRRPLLAERDARAPSDESSGSAIDWTDVEKLYEAVGLPPLAQATASRVARSRLRKRPAGRPHDVIDVVARPETDDWPGDHRSLFRGAPGHAASRSSTRSMPSATGPARS